MQKKSKLKVFIIVLLCLVLVLESVIIGLIATSTPLKDTSPTVVIQDTAVVAVARKDKDNKPAEEAPAEPAEEPSLMDQLFGENADVSGMLHNLIYSDSIVSMLMSVVYPMLYDAVKDQLAFATGIHLYGDGADIAQQMGAVPYTAVDIDGVRKPLTDVLTKVGTNWKYMKRDVTWTNKDGEEVTTDIYGSIEWGVKDAETFYQAMNDCALAFRGLIETTLQNKQVALELTGTMISKLLDGLPDLGKIPGINMLLSKIPVATALNISGRTDGTGRSGYQYGIIYLFNMLGLVDGEYPTNEEFCGYDNCGDCFKAIIEPVVYAVEKLLKDPLTNVCSLLLNLANAVDSGVMVSRFKKMSMYLEFSDLILNITSKLNVGSFESSEQFNLGTTLLNVIDDAGIPIYGSFNNLIQGAIKKFLGVSPSAFNTKGFLACGSAVTLSNGTRVYKANSDAVLGFLVRYLLQDGLLRAILNKVNFFNAKATNQIIKAVTAASTDLSTFLPVVLRVVLKNITKPAAK